MSRHLTPRSSLDNLRREAKRWLAALRSGDPDAIARFRRALPGAGDAGDPPHAPTLRDVQLALAREFGLPGWGDLARAVERARAAGADGVGTSPVAADALVARFLEDACPDHHVRGGPAHVRARHAAMRLLARHPELARASFTTAVVCGELETVERMLAERPELARLRDGAGDASRSGAGHAGDTDRGPLGAKGWEPLLHLCFTRLPLPAVERNAVAIARALLDRGADPNAFFMAGDSRYTPLVGVAGEGEEDRPPHPRRDELARLLLERGAEPFDTQVVYDIHFRGRVLWFLELIHEHSLRAGRGDAWDDPEWRMLDMGGYGTGARWHLDLAITHGDAALAAWCLAHGASPNAPPARDPRRPQRSLSEEAARRGRDDIAALLARHGATPVAAALEGLDAFTAAVLRLDADAARRLAAEHPEWLRETAAPFEAARRDHADAIALLLDLGVDPDLAGERGERALHVAASSGAIRVAELLLARGAEVDPVESQWGNTPLGAAVWSGHAAMIELLARGSRDVWNLTYAGRLDRLREVLAEDPSRARVASAGGHTPLMWLPPEDESLATATARLLLTHGADPTLATPDGQTAASRAERFGMYDLAEVLRAAGART